MVFIRLGLHETWSLWDMVFMRRSLWDKVCIRHRLDETWSSWDVVFMRHGLQKKTNTKLRVLIFYNSVTKQSLTSQAVHVPFLWHVLRKKEKRGEMYAEWGKLRERGLLEAKASQSNLAATFRKNLLLSSSRVSSGLLNPRDMICGNPTP